MSDLQGGQTFINVLPSMTGYFQRMSSALKNNKVTQNVDVALDQKRLDKAKSDLEKLTKTEEAAKKKSADATGAQTTAEAKLKQLRLDGVTDLGRIATAEENVAKAKRNSEAAAKSLADAESKRGAGERRVQRIEATFDGSRAEADSRSFLQRLAARSESEGDGIGKKLVGGIGNAMKIGAVAVGGAVAGVLGVSMKKGMDRLVAIDDAKAKLMGLGHTTQNIEAIMNDAMASVKGTSFGLGDAATVAASTVAAGIEPGKKLERTLSLVGDAATIAGTDLGSMGAIFNKVASRGKLTSMEVNQLAIAGIPVLQLLGKEMGKTTSEVQALISSGGVDFETFQNAIEKGMGGAARAGDTFSAATANAGAAMGRLGAAILDAPFKMAPKLIGKYTAFIDGLTDKVKGIQELLMTGTFGDAWEKAFPGKDLDNSLIGKFLVETNQRAVELGATLKLFRTGDFDADIGRALGVDEDSALVDKILRVRDGVAGLKEFIATGNIGEEMARAFDFDMPLLGKMERARETVIEWGGQIGRILGTVKDTFVELGPPVGQIIGSLAEASASIGISVWSIFLDTLEALLPIIKDMIVPAVQLLADLMKENQGVVTVLVGVYTGYRLAIVGARAALIAKSAAIGAWTLAVKLGTAAVRIKTIAVRGLSVATKVATIGFRVAAAAARLFGAALKANPIMAIIGVVTLLVGALVWFFTKTELGKKIWDKVWGGIKDAMSKAWDFLRPIFEKIGEIASTVFSAIGDIFSWLYDNVISPVFTGIKIAIAIVITAFLLWWDYVNFVIGLIGDVLTWLWENVAQPVWEKMKEALAKVGEFFSWVWESLIKPAWEGLGKGISWVWENVIRPVWDGLKFALGKVGEFFSWVWNSVIKPAWEGLGKGISWVWEKVIQPAWDGLKKALGAVGDFFKSVWEGVIKPAWDGLGNGIKSVWENVISPAWDKMKEGLGKVGEFFDTIVKGIRDVWDRLKGYLAKPINFMINTVWNEGIAKAWNKVRDFIPGLSEAKPLAGIPERATGGPIVGPGTGTSDDVLMWGSNGEHMMTTKEVQKVGGHNAVYALRDMIMRGIPFSWDGGNLIREMGRDNVNAYGAQVAQHGLGNVDPQGMFDWLLPKYRDGGEIRPMWETQLENGHRAAKMRNGNPYTWGFEDCSGYMSAIADAIINGGNGSWKWATGSFPGGQPWVPGLGQGFSVGVHDNPGGPGGGHTAGTLTGVGGYSTTNVESGGAHNYVAYGGPAAGADSPQFAGRHPGLFHLAIGADGAFESGGGGGGPSPEQKKSFVQRKIADVLDFFLNPVKERIAGDVGSPPPAWLGIPPGYLDTGRDKVSGFLAGTVTGLGDLLGSVWDKAKGIGGLFRDQGGWIPTGRSIVRNETGKPEAVLNWDQIELIRDILGRIGLGGTDKVAKEGEVIAPVDWAGAGLQIGTSFLAEMGNDLLAMFGIGKQFEGLQLVDEHGRRADEPGERNEASFNESTSESDSSASDSAVTESTVSDSTSVELSTPAIEASSSDESPMSVVDTVKAAFKPYGWDTGEQWAAVDWIIQKESGWNPLARNPKSGAFSLFQFLGSTKDQYLPDESEDPAVQGAAGAKYIRDRYGDPVRARTFWEKNGYYDQGGMAFGKGFMLKDVIHPERVLSPRQTEAFENLVPMLSSMQMATTAPGEVMPDAARSALEYAPVSTGATYIINGKADRGTMSELGIHERQSSRTYGSRMR
ncbi:tape measure domain-containing protein [Rhodococcus sp. 27YEA15]|uniref:aggregation-promoting factor C-terminal-like domain-containing protein n=1 Tax=Rhodococcus sp. 27YEA15 TaxID=3156259 RepID=UPI003C7D0D91